MKPSDLVKSKYKKQIGGAGRSSEKKTAKRLGARLTPASGALDGAKGDMEMSGFLIENKSTTAASFGVQLEHLMKITREAQTRGLTPALTFQFTQNNGDPIRGGKWAMIPEAELVMLLERIKELEE